MASLRTLNPFHLRLVASYPKAQLGFVTACIMLIPVGIIYALTVVSSQSSPTPFVDELDSVYGPVIHVNLLYRHGDRTIITLYPLDPYGKEKYWPEGLGQLTKEGILRHLHLGKWLRLRYDHLLPNDWKKLHEALSVWSTNKDRTIMSAQAQLAGMFPLGLDGEDWNGLAHYPFPVHTVPEDDDNFIEMRKTCHRYDVLWNETKASKPYQDIMKKYQNITKLVEENFGFHIAEMEHFAWIYGTLQSEENRGLVLPQWASEIYPSPLIEPTIQCFKARTWTDPLKRLHGGPVIKSFLQNFRDKLSGKISRNISSYSGHDTSISLLLNSMNIFNDEYPPAGGMVLMELRRMNESATPTVTISYKNSSSEPFPLVLPNCSLGCPLEKMEALLSPIIPDDWEKECNELPQVP